ncbi:TPA: MFS transporter [Stenotrophomonas maltophilia]|nr:MFS transporter [Stenotrophomonas maltophilia]
MNARSILFALALGSFAIGVTEFAPMGLLPTIAADLEVSIPSAGMLITAYAVGVMLGAPTMTVALGRFSRRRALLGLMALFVAGNILSGLADTYGVLMVGRVVTSLSHGAFFGIGATVAADAVPPSRRASAVAMMFLGLTVANIGGVPLATWLRNAIGWRSAFLATGALGVLAWISLIAALPKSPAIARPDFRSDASAMLRRPVLLALLTTVLAAGSMFTIYTYVAPLLQTITLASNGFVMLGLMVIGLGFTLGNIVSGKLSDRSLQKTLIGALILAAVACAVLPLLAKSHMGAAIALLVWGAASFGVNTPVQTRVMEEAGQAKGLASSINIGAFNLGNALGAMAGGAVLSSGLGYWSIGPTAAVLALAAVGVAIFNRPRVEPSSRRADRTLAAEASDGLAR